MKRALAALIVLVLASRPAVVPAGVGHRQVWTADALRVAGVTRLGELATLIEDWHTSTIDGFTFTASANGLASLEEPRWSVVIDGQLIDMSAFGVMSLNRLPLSPASIDSVEIVTSPQLHCQRLSDGGVIHIHTSRAAPGVSAYGRVMAGNETGDPGPYRFTDLGASNVERIGPDYAAQLAYGTQRWHAQAGVNVLSHRPVDPATRVRNRAIAGGREPAIDVVAPFMKASVRALDGEHTLLVGYSRFEDFMFFKPYGREIPTTTELLHAGVSGAVHTGPGPVSYVASFTQATLGHRHNSLGLDFDWARRTARVGVEGSFRTGASSWRYGVGVRSVDVNTGFALSEDGFSLFALHAEWERPFAGQIENRIVAQIVTDKHDLSVRAAASQRWRLGEKGALSTHLSYSERLPEEDERIWYWDERGYAFLESNGVAITRDKALAVARRVAAEFAWEGRVTTSLTAEVSGIYRWLAKSQLEVQPFVYDSSDRSFGGPVELVSDQSAQVAGARASLAWKPDAKFHSRLTYRYLTDFSADDVYARAWDQVPEHSARWMAALTPVPNFSLWARLTYWGASHWADYELVEAQSDGSYKARLDETWLLDLSLQQWMSKRRLRASLGFQNLLNDTVRTHPVGASFDLTAYLQLEVLLGR